MRDTSGWYDKLAKEIKPYWPRDPQYRDVKPSLLFQVELNLRLLERLDPAADPKCAYTLLGGYPFAAAAGIATTDEHTGWITAVRHRLWKLRRRYVWVQHLETYWQLPERLRRYREPAGAEPMYAVEPTVLRERLQVYDEQLATMPRYATEPLPSAEAGQARFVERRHPASVTIPQQLCLPEPPGHDLASVPASTRGPLQIPLAELADTARWMDDETRERGLKFGNWVQRLDDLNLDVLAPDGRTFQESDTLVLDRLTHLVGMVGAGKSTLMTLIAVWGAHPERGYRTTLIVGDVAEQLTLTTMLCDLGLAATPVLGGSTRERHAARLHRRLATRGKDNLLAHDDPSFDAVSTACPLDALRGLEPAHPLRYADAPCSHLYPVKPKKPTTVSDVGLPAPYGSHASSPLADEDDDDLPKGDPYSCPMWSACPRHAPDRDMVDALIWIANPASLLISTVPRQQNPQKLRRLELACLRSDIIIVDETDRVQMNLDTSFAPAATLVVKGPESWLDRLHTHKIDELARHGRLQLSDRDVERWTAALDVVSTATNRIYAMLIADADLRAWVDIEYLAAWTLQEKLLNAWYPLATADTDDDGLLDDTDVYEADDHAAGEQTGLHARDEPWAPLRAALTEAFDDFRDDPLGDRGRIRHSATGLMVATTQDLLHTLRERETKARLRSLLAVLLDGSPMTTGQLHQPDPAPGDPERNPADVWGSNAWLERNTTRLRFTLLVAVLNHRLDRVTNLWPQVEAALRLESADNELSRRPPQDYAPVVPEAPMGNVLGFQYLPDEPTPDGNEQRSGTLRFFRCAGVGRELLLNLPAFGADPAAGRPGPNVLIMSGTSWAGTSTRAHVLAPVTAILKPSPDAIAAVRGTRFRVRFLYDGATPLRLSGARPDTRHTILRQMVTKLGKPQPGTTSSILDQELRRIGDDHRRRALLLVGSYKEATIAADTLEEIPRWAGRVRVLANDDAELDSPGTPGDGLTHAAALRRGDLASFADDPDAELLVAPLLAVERGHNILNSQRTAAFGVALFLARPHPRPDDLSLAVFAINDWVTRFTRDLPGLEAGTFSKLVADAAHLDAAGLAFRHLARGEWRRLLSRRYAYSSLTPAEKTSFAWDQLVTIWQVIGRLVRGGVPAEVVFVDAAFAPAYAHAMAPAEDDETAGPRRRRRNDPGLLIKLRDVLTPYFATDTDPREFPNPSDPALVQAPYQPLYDALCGMDFTVQSHIPNSTARTLGASGARTL